MRHQMRAASAAALSELSGQLGTSRLADSATLGEELFGVVALLRTEPGLRRVVTDPSIEADAKAGLVGNVLGERVGAKTLEIVTDAVRRRWTTPRDLADSLEQLAVVATVRSAGAKDGSRVGDELFAVAQLVRDDQGLYSALTDSGRTTADRSDLLVGLVAGKALPATETLVRQAVTRAGAGHGSVDSVLADFQSIAAESQDEVVAVVRTARELGSGDLDRLTTALGRAYSSAVQLHVVVEPDLIGGLRVEIGDDVIDGTLATRLDEARRAIAG